MNMKKGISAFAPWMLPLVLLLLAMPGCSRPEAGKPRTLVDSLPVMVVNVDGVMITRDEVASRLEQYRTILAHSQHNTQALASSGLGVSASAVGADPHAMHQPIQGTNVPKEAATVSHEERGASNTDPLQERMLLRTIINQLVLEHLKREEAQRLGLSVSPALLQEQVAQAERHFGSPAAFEEALRKGHISREQWKNELQKALLFQQLELRRREALPVTEEEIHHYWEQNHEKLAPLWQVQREEQARDQLRGLIQQVRWSAVKAEWEQALGRAAKIWVNPSVRDMLIIADQHTH